MTELIKEVFLSVDTWKIAVPTFFIVVGWLYNEHRKRVWEKWQIKKSACMKALTVANAVISNYKYDNIRKEEMTPQILSVDVVRECFNELAFCCDSDEVITTLKHIVLNHSSGPGDMVKLRTAVRKELGFGTRAIDKDLNMAFIGRVSCDPNAKY